MGWTEEQLASLADDSDHRPVERAGISICSHPGLGPGEVRFISPRSEPLFLAAGFIEGAYDEGPP